MQDAKANNDAKDNIDDDSVKLEVSTKSRSASQHSNKKKGAGWSTLQQQIKIDVSQVMHKQIAKYDHTIKDSLEDVILLDTSSSIGGTFMNHDMVTHIKATKEPIQMNTNAGYKVLELKGQVPGFGKVYYDPDMMTNIFRFAKLAKK